MLVAMRSKKLFIVWRFYYIYESKQAAITHIFKKFVEKCKIIFKYHEKRDIQKRAKDVNFIIGKGCINDKNRNDS